MFSSYQGPPSGAAYEAWREVACRLFCGLDIQPSTDDAIDCRLQISLFGDLALAMPSGNSAQFSRTAEVIGDGCDDFVLVTAESGMVPVIQKSTEIGLLGQQMCLTDMSVLGTIEHGPRGQFNTTRIPRRALLAIAPRAEDRLAVAIAGNDVLRETISRYISLSAEVAPKLDTVGQQLMAQHLIDLIGLLTSGDPLGANGTDSRSAAQFDLIRADALRNLGSPGLSLAVLAHRYGLSERHAYRLFERSGSTFTEFVLEQRLLLVHRMLLDLRNRARKVSDIAHAAGFSDLSYFNRAFRRRFGGTPSDIRHAGPETR